MMSELSSDVIRKAICNLTEVEATQQGFEVTLPQVYSTGQAVVVVISKVGDQYEVHDNSYAALLLTNAGVRVGARLAQLLSPSVREYGCDLAGMRVMRRCSNIDSLAFAMTTVGCASRLVADHALRADPAPLVDFKSSVLHAVLRAVGESRVRINEEVSGHLGGRYRVTAMVLDKARAKPVAFVEPIADREAVARRFKQFYDLSMTTSFTDVERLAVYDDNNPIPASDAMLMEEVGSIVRYADAPVRLRNWATIQ